MGISMRVKGWVVLVRYTKGNTDDFLTELTKFTELFTLRGVWLTA